MNFKALLLLPALLAIGIVAAVGSKSAVAPLLPDSVKLVYEFNWDGTEVAHLISKLHREGQSYEVKAETRSEGVLHYAYGTLQEETRFSVSADMQIKPQYYKIEADGWLGHSYAAEFLWDKMQIRYAGGKTLRIPLKGYVITNTSVPYAFAGITPAMLKAYPYIHILGDDKLRHYQDIDISRETIKVPAGEFRTVRIDLHRVGSPDKVLSIWLAPTRHNVAVKIRDRRESRTFTTSLSSSEGLGG